ncbi:MAG: metallophosphoesterase [Candidatus Eremiobacteraeota bacterium]|nr:metallophosphoesterase [Candidatus Eremiobacteraeota bacterium]
MALCKAFTRKKIVKGILAFTALLIAGAVFITCVEPFSLQITRHELIWEQLPEGLEGLTFTHLTDFHHGKVIPLGYIKKCVARSNALSPDLVFLTGDYVSRAPEYIAPCIEALSSLKSRYGVFAVPGNHDYWTDIATTRKEFARTGIHLLVNRSDTVTIKGASLAVIGLDDLWAGIPDMKTAAAGVSGPEKKILLMHNPDLFEEYAPLGFDLILSGHTHGGQVNIPFIGPPITPSRFGARYAAGLYRKDKSTLYVNRGIGMVSPPIRFFCRPELAFFTIRGKPASR